MAYKTNITKEFKSKGFIAGENLISSEKKDAGTEYPLQQIFDVIARDGVEIEFSLKVKETMDTVEED